VTGRIFNTPNATRPACIEQMAQIKPLCFSSRATWQQWLEEAWRMTLNKKAERAAMTRGVVPEYCSECTTQFRARMHGEGRCKPPAESTPPPLSGTTSEAAVPV
jgi:hypothetical protein